jgi:hypothetical protein
MRTDTRFVHPEDSNNMLYWSKKWGVSPSELKEAILYTGSLRTSQIRNYLHRDSWLYHPFKAIARLSSKTYQLFF